MTTEPVAHKVFSLFGGKLGVVLWWDSDDLMDNALQGADTAADCRARGEVVRGYVVPDDKGNYMMHLSIDSLNPGLFVHELMHVMERELVVVGYGRSGERIAEKAEKLTNGFWSWIDSLVKKGIIAP